MVNFNNNKMKFSFTGSRFVPDDTARGLFFFLVFQTVVSLVYQVLFMLGFQQNLWSYVFTLILDLCFVGCVYFVARPRKINMIANLRLKRAPTLKQIALCVGISIICLFGFSSLTNLFLEVLYRFGYSSVTSDIVIPNFGYYLLYVGFICIVPAICEEILFRGLICNGLKKLGSVTAVLGSAFLFMIMHGSPDQTVHQFILGVILALAFLLTNNLWVPIIIHFLNNFIAVTISFVLYGDSVAESTTETAEIYLGEYVVFALISAVVAGIIMYYLLKLLSKCGRKYGIVEPVEKKQRIETLSSVSDSAISYERVRSGQVIETADFVEMRVDEGVKEASQTTEAEVLVPVDYPYENKLSTSGKSLYILSIVWLVLDWVSALVLGFTQIV